MEACHSNSYERLENAVQVSTVVQSQQLKLSCRMSLQRVFQQHRLLARCVVSCALCESVYLVSQLHDLMVDQVELNDKQKSIICERIGVRLRDSLIIIFIHVLSHAAG